MRPTLCLQGSPANSSATPPSVPSSGDRKAESLALLRSSIVALYSEDDPRNGIPVAARSAEAANEYSNVLFGLAQPHVAEGHAMLGEQRLCEAGLAEADRSFTQVDRTDVAAELYSPSELRPWRTFPAVQQVTDRVIDLMQQSSLGGQRDRH